MGMNMEDEELVKMVNPTLKRRENILFFLIVVINGLKCIVSDIGLDTCTRGRWRVEVIEPINRLIQTQSKPLQHTIHTKKKIERFLARKGVLSGGALGLNTLCRGCSSHTTLVGLLFPGGDKSEKLCTGYKV